MSTQVPLALRGFILDAPSPKSARGFRDGAVLIREGKIAAVGDHEEIRQLPEARDAIWSGGPHHAIVPGLIDLHAHIPQYPVVGRIEESLLPWLQRYIFPREREFRAETAREFAPYFFKELARNGTTLAVLYAAIFEDSCHECFAAAEASGSRAIIGKIMMDRGSYGGLEETKIPALSLEQTRRLIKRWHGAAGGRLGYAVSPRFAITCTAELMKAAGELAREHGTWIQTHLSENHLEIQTVRELFPDSPDYTSVYAECGLTGPRSIFGHCIHLSERETSILADSGSLIAHCPTSNLFLRSGILPWEKITSAEIPFGLGSDVAGGPELSMWRVMRSALESQIARSFHEKSPIPTPAEIFYQTTLGAAKALQMDSRIGSIEPGKDADLVVLDLAEVIPSAGGPVLDRDTGAEDLLSLLIHRAGPEATVLTMVQGRETFSRKASAGGNDHEARHQAR
jgi:guanine deaminase